MTTPRGAQGGERFKALSVREQRMLLSILELEEQQAVAARDRHAEAARADDTDAEVAHNHAYFMGAATAYGSIRRMFEEVING